MKKEVLLRAGKLEAILPDEGHKHRYSMIIPIHIQEPYFDNEVPWQKELIFEETGSIENNRRVYMLILIKDLIPAIPSEIKEKRQKVKRGI